MTTYSLRADPEIDAAFEELGMTPGNRSKIMKDALLNLAEQHRRDELRRETAALAADPEDRAEMQAVLEDMEALRAW